MEKASSNTSDKFLVAASIKGSHHAYSELYETYAGQLLATIWRMTGGDYGETEDILQETFVRAWSRLRNL